MSQRNKDQSVIEKLDLKELESLGLEADDLQDIELQTKSKREVDNFIA